MVGDVEHDGSAFWIADTWKSMTVYLTGFVAILVLSN